MDNRGWFYLVVFSICAGAAGLLQAGQIPGNSPAGLVPFVKTSGPYSAGNSRARSEIRLPERKANPNCREWKEELCTVCAIDSAFKLSLRNKTKTPLLLCPGMKPGPARVVMMAHAEPTIPGLWEVEFGLGYQTSARNECPHQFVASNNPPLQTAYEVGPITIEAEIPPDGTIQTLACVGLSSARVGEEGKETGASLKVFKLRIASE